MMKYFSGLVAVLSVFLLQFSGNEPGGSISQRMRELDRQWNGKG